MRWRFPAVRRVRLKKILVVGGGLGLLLGTAVLLEALIRADLSEIDGRTPVRYYARPLVLYPGAGLSRDRIETHLERNGYRRTRRPRVGVGEFYRGRRELIIGRRAFRHGDWLEPAARVQLRFGYRGAVSSLVDEDRQYLRQFVLEPEPLPSPSTLTAGRREPIPLEQIPEDLINAVLTIEDQRFFEHRGLDVRRIGGAAVANVRAGKVVQGASTITQQLVKNLFLSPERTVTRKVRELAMATILERRHSKTEILEAYLNEIYLGQNGGSAIHGVGAAARHYFDKDVSELNLSDAALLAGLIRGPSLYAPSRHPERARQRRNLVLHLMAERGRISADARRNARDAEIRLARPRTVGGRGRYFVDYVHGASGDGDADRRGSAVFTTLDLDLQIAAEETVASGLARLEASHDALRDASSPLQAALVALNPRTGEILAMVGGRDFGASQFNRAVYARRQPGSAFKPFVALAALSGRSDFTLASSLRDEPLSVITPAGVWEPSNYDGRFRGRVSLREALERSLNVPFARLGLSIGPERIVETAEEMGIGDLNAVPSIALGSSEVTPLGMARAYGVFAAEGFRADLQTTLGVLDQRGEWTDRASVAGERVHPPAETYLVTSALEGAVERGTGRGVRRLGYRGPVAAKSGTTNNYRDAWFVGYTPDLAVAVWVGFDDGRSIGLPGSVAALPIFTRFLIAAGLDQNRRFDTPIGIETAYPSCRGNGEVFLVGTAPASSCSRFGNLYDRYRSRGSRRWDTYGRPRRELPRRRTRRGTG